jgi:hypothetical protein
MRKIIVLILLSSLAAAASSQVSDTVLRGLVNRAVLISERPGDTVSCTLLSFDDRELVGSDGDGNLIALPREEVESIRLSVSPAAQLPAAASVAERPLSPSYFFFDPLGLLQVGPSFEIGIRIAQSATLGAVLRLEGAGLLYRRLVAGESSTAQVSFGSMSFGLDSYQLFGGSGMNRWYLMEGLAISSGSLSDADRKGDFTRHWTLFEAMSGFGHRWRSLGGFFVDVGALAGFAQPLRAYWSYDSSPSVKTNSDVGGQFVGMAQLHFGWELGQAKK